MLDSAVVTDNQLSYSAILEKFKSLENEMIRLQQLDFSLT